MPSFGVYLPDESPLAKEIERRAEAQHDGKVSAYVRAAIERDLQGTAPDPMAADILTKLAKGLRPEISDTIAGLKNQPATLALLLEALAILVRRQSDISQRLYLVTMREAATMAIGTATKQYQELAQLALSIAPDITHLIEDGILAARAEFHQAEREEPMAAEDARAETHPPPAEPLKEIEIPPAPVEPPTKGGAAVPREKDKDFEHDPRSTADKNKRGKAPRRKPPQTGEEQTGT